MNNFQSKKILPARLDSAKRAGRRGFTLIEIMLIVTLLAVIGGISAPIYQSLQVKNSLSVATHTVVQALRRAQVLSQSGEGDSSWGVHMASGRVILFKGSSFAARDASFDEVSEISANIALTGISEVVYSKLLGEPGNVGIITLTTSNNDSGNITINAKGTIEY